MQVSWAFRLIRDKMAVLSCFKQGPVDRILQYFSEQRETLVQQQLQRICTNLDLVPARQYLMAHTVIALSSE